jgi:hypothetical protein
MPFDFHVKDGSTILDEGGAEFPSVEAVKDNAIRASGEMLRGLDHGQDSGQASPGRFG